MPYAHNNQISTDPIEGGIIISEQQYADALAAMQSGKLVSVVDGAFVLAEPLIQEPESHSIPDEQDPPRTSSSLEFFELFTDDEQLTVVTATLENPVVKLWYDKLMAADIVVYNDDRLIQGMQSLVGAGLISDVRRNEILDI